MIAYYKRELFSYFRSPIGWVAISIFALISGFYLSSSIAGGVVNLSGEIVYMRSVLFLIIPLITMRLFAEEKRNGTDILMYTSPTPLHHIVIAKYLASYTLFLLMSLNILVHMIIVVNLGGLVNARTFASLIAFLFLGAAFLAIGTMASAITENQVIASLLSLTIIFFAQYFSVVAAQLKSILISLLNVLKFLGLGSEAVNSAGQSIENAVNWFDPYNRLDSLYVGNFNFSPLVYCSSLVLVFLFITYRILEKKRWNQS